MVIIALSSVGGCDIVQKVQKSETLWDNLGFPATMKTCVFGDGDLVSSLGITKQLKPVFDILDKINLLSTEDDKLAVCPMAFFFKSNNITGATTDGHEDI